jgi:hypothetical protein
LKIRNRFYMGVDLGQRRDHSAVAILESRLTSRRERDRVSFQPVTTRSCGLVHVDRIPLRTSFLRVVEKLFEMLTSVQLRHSEVVLAVDATGVGAGVFETVEKMVGAARQARTAWVNLAGVVFTSGGKESWDGLRVQAPKNELLGGLLLAMEKGELHLNPRKPWRPELLRELDGMRRVMGETTVRWTSVEKHDDLVMALALAQWGRKFRPLPGDWKALQWEGPDWERALRGKMGREGG